jgi:diaminobutyrate-2-oxoglutarate transaminase
MSADKSAETTIFTRRESEVRSYCRSFDTVFNSAKGSHLTDVNGRKYIDFLAGCSSLNYGHNDPDMQKALIEHITADGITHGLDMYTSTKAAFLEAFERIILKPRGMDHKVMMTGPTGTNAVEAAMKLARKVTGRETIVAFTNGFHGMTMGALAATGNAGKRAGGGMALHGVVRMPYEGAFGPEVDTLAQIEAMLDNPSSGIDAPAAFLVEPVQGEGGLNAASADWLRGIARIAKKHGALLILDDIQAGIGRTGPFFSFEEWASNPT